MAAAAQDGLTALLPEARWIWRAWHRLAVERTHTVEGIAIPMGGARIVSRPGGIPWTAVDRWCERHGYGADDREMLDAALRAMDATYRADWLQRQQEAT